MKPLAKRVASTLLLAGVVVTASAHVGSPNVFFAGKAGAYDVNVVIRPPAVVPGTAEIIVRLPVSDARSVQRVVVRPVYWLTGTRGSPAGDVAKRVEAPEPTYAGRLWLMSGGSYSVYVSVEGTRGTGTAVIPVAAVATARLTLGRGLTVILVLLGAFLFVGMATLVRAGASDGLVPAGETPSPRVERRGRLVMAVSLPVLAVICFGGWRWWGSEARAYERTLYRPLGVRASVADGGATRTLTLEITDSAYRAGMVTRIIPDHGKLMHMFVIRDSSLDVFAHLHPVMRDENTFETPLPPLPPGRYRVYGDIVHESGFERTLVATFEARERGSSEVREGSSAGAREARATAVALSGDDGWTVNAAPVPMVAPRVSARLADGSLLTWHADAERLRTNRETLLRFDVSDSSGRAVALEPYLGMSAHAVVMRDDGSVFIHLHPMGTVTAAAQTAFMLRERGDTTSRGRLRLDDTMQVAHSMAAMRDSVSSSFAFPYEFPKPGAYRIWVQVKRGGRVLTGAFEARVE